MRITKKRTESGPIIFPKIFETDFMKFYKIGLSIESLITGFFQLSGAVVEV